MVDLEKFEQELDALLSGANQALNQADQPEVVEAIRVKYLGRHSESSLLSYFEHLRGDTLSAQEKAKLGQRLNALKQRLEQAIEERRQAIAGRTAPASAPEDMTLPGHLPSVGRLHPITQTISQTIQIFRSLGFSVVDGPEVETEYYNFEALNIPAEHPSRESFDTFYIKGEKERLLLRSHTSPVQIRFMQANRPPFQIVVPGRVFRPDAVDPSHCFQFHQVEGLAVGPGLTFADLKGTLSAWARGMFGQRATLRFRPHYFPFTEPSAEVDLSCIFCQAKGCRVCARKGWLEILGCGMVHPNVFKSVNYPHTTVGLAFGMGVERIAMLQYGIEDIRLFYENDLRFLVQFP